MTFFKKKSRGKLMSTLIPKDTLECLDDVGAMEESARQLQQTLKSYIHSQKDEISKCKKFLLMVDQNVDEVDYSADVAAFINIERQYTQSLESTGSGPLKSYCKIFPKLNSASNGLVRAAQDQRKAEEKNNKKADLKTKVQLEKAKTDLDQKLKTVPPAMADVLVKTKEHMFVSLSATLQAQMIYYNDAQDFFANADWSQITRTDDPQETKTQGFIDETQSLLDEIATISIVGKPKRQSSSNILARQSSSSLLA